LRKFLENYKKRVTRDEEFIYPFFIIFKNLNFEVITYEYRTDVKLSGSEAYSYSNREKRAKRAFF